MNVSFSKLQVLPMTCAAALLGCTEVSVSEHEQGLFDCDENGFGCSTNSPEIDHYGFHELNLFGLANSAGIRIEAVNGRSQIYKSGKAYNLMVKESRILGAEGSTPVLMGQDLVGAEIRLWLGKTPDYVIRIESVRPITFPFGTPDPLEAYHLSWYGPNLTPDSKRAVCKVPTAPSSSSKTLASGTFSAAQPTADAYRPPTLDLDLLNMRDLESVVFEGDRIDARTKTMSATFDDEWFNIGCARHTLAKMHLMRQTLGGFAEQQGVYHRGRQASLKLLTGDYCGSGKPFTVAGVKLVWKGDLIPYLRTPVTLEARWTEKGASCLNVARLEAIEPHIYNLISQHCTIPACSNTDPVAFDGAVRVSALPAP